MELVGKMFEVRRGKLKKDKEKLVNECTNVVYIVITQEANENGDIADVENAKWRTYSSVLQKKAGIWQNTEFKGRTGCGIREVAGVLNGLFGEKSILAGRFPGRQFFRTE